MTRPPRWLVSQVGGLSPWLFERLFRYCFRCDLIRWRRHAHPPMPASVVVELHQAVGRRRDGLR